MNKELGDTVRKLRKAKDWSQADLAEKAGTTQQTISNVELGKYDSARDILAIARALGVRAETLGGFSSTDYADRIHEMVEGKPLEEQEKAYNLLKVFLGEE